MFVRRIPNPTKHNGVYNTVSTSLNDQGYTLTQHGLKHDNKGYFLSKEHALFFKKRDNEPERVYSALAKEAVPLIVNDLNLKSLRIPIDAPSDTPHCNVYYTEGSMEAERLVLLFSGDDSSPLLCEPSSVAKYGIKNGSYLNLVQHLSKIGYGVIVLNAYENQFSKHGYSITLHEYDYDAVPIPGSEGPTEHLFYVWDNLIGRVFKASNVVFLGVGYSGISILDLLDQKGKGFTDIVCGAILMESVHSVYGLNHLSISWMKKKMLNWIKSEKDIGETVDDDGFGCRCFSLGKRAPEFDLTDDMVVSTVFKHTYVSLFPNVIAQLDSLFNESVFNPI